MAEEISHLIEVLNGDHDKLMEIGHMDFVHALRQGIKTEPDKFPQLVDALEASITRENPGMSPELVRQRALEILLVMH